MAGISRRINGKPKGFVKNTTAQGLVENLIVTMLFLTAVIFTIIQISLITINALIAGEAAFAAARASVVAPTQSEANDIIDKVAAILVVPHFSPDNFIPLDATLWRKKPLGTDNQDNQGLNIYSYTVNIKYVTKVMFAGVLQPLLGDLDPFIITGGRAGSFYSRLALPFTAPTNARARLVKSPDKDFLYKPFPDAPKW